MANNFLDDKIDEFMSEKTNTGGFMLSRAPSYSCEEGSFPIKITNKEQEILKHDFESFAKVMSFLKNESLKVFILHGFMGSGKSAIINIASRVTNESVLVFRVNCFDSTNLDDVLLSLHTDFVNYHNSRRIILPKVDTNVFADRINTYIKSCKKLMLFIFDSIDCEAHPLQKDIINFIQVITQIDGIKVIINSRNLASNILEDESNTNFAVIKLYGKEEFVSLLKKNNIEAKEETYEEVFNATKGHYLYISLLINVILLLNISLASIYNDYKKKNVIIFDFLIAKVLPLIPEKFLKTLWFLSLIRTGVSEQFLIEQKLSTHDEIEYLEERMLICRESGKIYMKDFIKSNVTGTINSKTKKDINNYLYELYESQLPKKPTERDLPISRSTMRREAAYHKEIAESTIIDKPQGQNNKRGIDYSYLSYSKGNKNDWNFSETSIAPKQRTIKPAPRGMETRIRNNLRAKNFELSNEELNLLNKLNLKVPNAELIRETPQEIPQRGFQMYMQTALPKIRNKSEKTLSDNAGQIQERKDTLSEIMNAAKVAEENFEYENAILLYNKAYGMTEAPGYQDAKPIIMMQTALCHRKKQNNEEALRCFDIAYRLYSNENPEKANIVLYNIAEIYNETYNYEQAKSMYERILVSKESSDKKFIIRVLLNIADIEQNNSNIEKAFIYFKEALKFAIETEDKRLICECCFKYGLACDDAGNIDQAFKLYVQCIQTSSDYEINSFISSAYSNIAGIYEEQNLTDKAAKYYEEAIKADEANKNWDGLYYAYTKMAGIYQMKSVTIAIDYLFKALNSAENLKDNSYIASTYIQIGDYYYKANSNEDALKSYLLAKAILIKQPNPENVRKIDVRINDMRTRLGSVRYNEIIAELQTR